MTTRSFSVVCLALIALGLIASGVIASQRWRIEAANRTVELAVDYDEAVILAGQKGLSTSECLRSLKQAGVTSLAIQEVTLETLVRDGRLLPVPSPGGKTTLLLQGQLRNYIFRDGNMEWLRPQGETGELPTEPPTFVPYLQSKIESAQIFPPAVTMPTPPEPVWTTGLGLPPQALEDARAAGLSPIARPSNDPLVSSQYLQRLSSDLSAAGVQKVVCAGKSVLGFPGLLEETAQLLPERGLAYCWVEFAEQLGEEKLTKLLNYHRIRLHSINPEEMLRLKPEEALDRLLRAAKERSIRLLYVHFPPAHSSNPLADPVQFVTALAHLLQQNGLRLGQTQLLADYSPPILWVLLVGIAICASPFLLLNHWRIGSPRLLLFLLLSAALAASGLLFTSDGLARPLLALLAASVFPVLAIAVVIPLPSPLSPAPCPLTPALTNALLRLIACTAVSLVGGLFVAAILTKTSYFVGGQLFRGIKLAQVLPLVVIFILLIGDADSQGQQRISGGKIGQFLGLNLQIKHLLGLLFVLVIAMLWIMRTGNQPEAGVFPFEMKLRAFLERALVARPRTKEFLFGHPLLLLGFLTYPLAAIPRWRFWASALILVGALGQVSVVNTFCHLHSPIYLGLLRTFNGLWLGALIGVIPALLIFPRHRLRKAGATSETDRNPTIQCC